MSRMAIKCKVDSLGRVTLPIQYRRALNIDVRDDVNIEFKENGLFIYKEDDADVLKKKINDIIEVASDCAVLNGNEREELNKILSKLV
jgi:bifunctional DNA-binding transcriptional regulator/antitoxin component of YhaV-PrlF toxin-antitoxin module